MVKKQQIVLLACFSQSGAGNLGILPLKTNCVNSRKTKVKGLDSYFCKM